MYRDRVALGGQRVDCIAIQYIVLQQSGLAGIALPYNTMYCDRKGSLRLGSVSRGRPRYGHACARTSPRHGTSARGTEPTIRRRGACDTTRHPVTRPGATATTRPGMRAPVRACVPSWASWVFCAPGSVFNPVFDSVLFPSHRLDPVHEHCS